MLEGKPRAPGGRGQFGGTPASMFLQVTAGGLPAAPREDLWKSSKSLCSSVASGGPGQDPCPLRARALTACSRPRRPLRSFPRPLRSAVAVFQGEQLNAALLV